MGACTSIQIIMLKEWGTSIKYIYARFLENKNIRSADVQSIVYSSQIKHNELQLVTLNNNDIGPLGAKYLSQSKWLNLTTINLANNHIGDKGVKYLSNTKWLKLRQINLVNNDIGDIGAKYISICRWPILQKINLDKNKIGDEGAKYLSTSKWSDSTKVRLNEVIYSFEDLKVVYKVEVQVQYSEQTLIPETIQQMKVKQTQNNRKLKNPKQKKVTKIKLIKTQQDDDGSNKCVICLVNQKDCLNINCRHLCCCFQCGHKLKSCPLCRKDMKYLKIYI